MRPPCSTSHSAKWPWLLDLGRTWRDLRPRQTTCGFPVSISERLFLRFKGASKHSLQPFLHQNRQLVHPVLPITGSSSSQGQSPGGASTPGYRIHVKRLIKCPTHHVWGIAGSDDVEIIHYISYSCSSPTCGFVDTKPASLLKP